MKNLQKLKKENWYKLLYIVSALALLGFGIRLGADFYTYSGADLAVPRKLMIERCIEFLLPSILFFVVACVVKRKLIKKN